MGEVWLPGWSRDLKLAAAAGAMDTNLEIEYSGYEQFGYQQLGRRDLRFELVDGTVLMRRIEDCAFAGSAEIFTIDAALGVAITPATVRRITFMALCEAASDSIELLHVTDADGLTECSLQFEAAEEVLDEL